MKKFLPAVAGWLAIACTQPALAQSAAPCDAKGIATDPAQPASNPEFPARTNTFNWYYGQQNNGRWWNLNNPVINESAIWMPWQQSDNSSLTHILGKNDLPKDGWELIKRDLGFNDSGAPVVGTINPYVVLYNKRTATLRVFVAMGELFNSYQFAEIKLRFNSNGAQKKAGTLNRMEGIGTALENTVPGLENEFAAMVPFLNQRAKWFMADFPMEYDPCTCQFDSKFVIDVNLVSQADVQLTGTTTGSLVTADAGTSQTSTDYNRATPITKRTKLAVKAGQKTYKSLNEFANGVKKELTAQGSKSSVIDADTKKAAIDKLKEALGKSDFLKAGLSALPYLGTAVSVLDAFFGGGKEESTTQPISMQPMTLEMTTQMAGTISAANLYTNITFNNPGTRTITTPEDYPYYNEALGVLSVLRSPTVQVRKTTYTDPYDGRSRRLHQYRIPNPIQYLINPASGLEVQDFQVAILQEGKNYPAIFPNGSGWEYEGLTSTGTHTLRTVYVDASGLSNYIFDMDVSNDKMQNSEFIMTNTAYPIYVKFMLNLRPRNATSTTQNVLLVLKYPVVVQNVTQFGPMAALPGGVLAQATPAAVQAFCSSAVYAGAMNLRPAKFAGTATGATAAAVAVTDVQVFPNPAAGAATVRFAGVAQGRVSAYLLDMLGRRVLTILADQAIAPGEQQQRFSTAQLPAGLYQCVLETAGGSKTTTRLSVAH